MVFVGDNCIDFGKFGLMFFWNSSRYSLQQVVLTIGGLLLTSLLFSQETTTANPFETPNKPILGLLNSGSSLEDYSFLDKKEEPKSTLFDQERFIDNSAPYLKRLREREESNANLGYLGDTYLGDVKTNSKTAVIVCRDFEYEDGDRVAISLNDEVLLPNLYLKNKFFVFEIELKPGFNKFDFQALNQGSSGPNTAELRVYDEDKKLLASNQWNLSTGATATFIVVKQM
jgi:hypothetical protein